MPSAEQGDTAPAQTAKETIDSAVAKNSKDNDEVAPETSNNDNDDACTHTSSLLKYIVDDYSLQTHGQTLIRSNGDDDDDLQIRIYEGPAGGQLILESRVPKQRKKNGIDNHNSCMAAADNDDDDDEQTANAKKIKFEEKQILIRSVNDQSYAFSFLRASYSLMAVFVAGFLFILGFCILLFLFIDMATSMGAGANKGGEKKWVAFFGVLLSVPVFVYSLAMGMTLATKFVVDTFSGHPFLRSFGIGTVRLEWMAFAFYLGIPLVTFIITLFMGKDDWWAISLLTWYASILIFWCLFSLAEFCWEIRAFTELMEEYNSKYKEDSALDSWPAEVKRWCLLAQEGCIETMKYRLSGRHIEQSKFEKAPRFDRIKFWFTSIWCFDKMDEYERDKSLDEVLGNKSYVTRYSWSLEQLFCRRGGLHSTIPITTGDLSIRPEQINSNIACHVLGALIIILLFASGLAWMNLPGAGLTVAIIGLIVSAFSVGLSIYRLWGLKGDITSNVITDWNVYRHSTPKVSFVWFVVGSQIVFFYLLPLIYLCVSKNAPSAVLFTFLGIFSSVRHYLNPRVLLLVLDYKKRRILRDSSFIDTTKEKSQWENDQREWKSKSRLYHLVAVGGDKARSFWVWTYILCVIFFLFVAVGAVNEKPDATTEHTEQSRLTTLMNGYAYPPQPDLPYPTCKITKGFAGKEFSLADVAFLSKLAYSDNKNTEQYLDAWFGTGVAKDDIDAVKDFKKTEKYSFGSAVSYKYITFPENDGVLTIRGTQTFWDLIADAQLWLPAGLFQIFQVFLPLSNIFTPILDKMVTVVKSLETEAIEDVSYYQETSGFINYLKDTKKTTDVLVTGHSLGGGLAIITGAQTNTNAIVYSGPNAILSRNTFTPVVTMDQLNNFTFNVIPARDPFPKFDIVAKLYQNIECRAAANNFMDCHMITRSLCEILYTCGSSVLGNDRPIPCECVLDYGYEVPLVVRTNQTDQTTQATTQAGDFKQVCAEKCSDSGWSTAKCETWGEKAKA